MRKDLNKQLCERQRRRSSMKYNDWRRDKHYEEHYRVNDNDSVEDFHGVASGHRESMTKRYGWDRKEFNENLKPLYGFIHKSVGRKWNDVYSEICQVFDKRSVINQHILIHLDQYVEKQIEVRADGKLYIIDYQYAWRNGLRLLEEDRSVEYYVDPRDGILKRNTVSISRRVSRKRERARYEAEQAKTHRVLNKTTELWKLDGLQRSENGVWFEVKFIEQKPVRRFEYWQPTRAKHPMAREITEYPLILDVLKGHVREKRVAASKRQLSKKELKQHGLTNGQ